jgi:hypothetical protein
VPRELRTELETLIDSGHCNWATAIDITLTGLPPVHFSSTEIVVDRFDVDNRQYLGKLRDIKSCDMSLDPEVDQIEFGAANVDMVMGRTLTGATRRLDGAKAVRGVIFIDKDLDFEDNQHIYDPTLPGELVAGEVGDEEVAFSLISEIDSVIISGRTIASEFQWREPLSNIPLRDPSDIGPFGGGGGRGTDLGDGNGGGRYGDFDPIKVNIN